MTAVASKITKPMVEDAVRKFEQLWRGMRSTGEEPEDVDELHVPIARGVTAAEYKAIPQEWMGDVASIDLDYEKTVVVTEIVCRQHTNARELVESAMEMYTQGVGAPSLEVRGGFHTVPNGENDRVVDVALLHSIAGTTSQEPIVLCDVDVWGHTCNNLTQKACDYLRDHPSVERVVDFKFFPPLAHEMEEKRLAVAALALVFQREDDFATTDRIRVTGARSFGNAKLGAGMLATLQKVAPSLVTEELSGVPYAGVLRTECVKRDLWAWRCDPKWIASQPMLVKMPHGLPDLKLPLLVLFEAAMQGWSKDQSSATEVQAKLSK